MTREIWSEIIGTLGLRATRDNDHMRTITALAFLLFAVSMSSAEGWLLKSPYQPHTKMKWKVVTDTTVSEHAVQSVVTHILKIASDVDGKATGTLDFTDMEINGNKSGFDAPTWDMVFARDGMLTTAGGGPDCLRQLAPTTFIYPNKEVAVGATWEATLKFDENGKGAKAKFTVLEMTKLHEEDVLKVKTTLAEESGLHSEGLFWLSKEGMVLKYKVDVKNWTVAGSGIPSLDAKLTGELVK